MTLKMQQPWLKINFFFKFSKYYAEIMKSYKIFFTFIEKLTKDHELEFPQPLKEKPTSYLDYLYQLRNTMGYTEHIEGIAMFLVAAYETSAVTISHSLTMLGMHQDIQDKAVVEIKSVLTSSDDTFDFEKLEKLVYLDMVMKESLRLIPVGLTLGRVAKKDLRLGKILNLNASQFSHVFVHFAQITQL